MAPARISPKRYLRRTHDLAVGARSDDFTDMTIPDVPTTMSWADMVLAHNRSASRYANRW